MSCNYCKHSYWPIGEMATAQCKASRRIEMTPEGVAERTEDTCLDALEEFRKQNGGACPHFKRRTWFNNLFPWL